MYDPNVVVMLLGGAILLLGIVACRQFHKGHAPMAFPVAIAILGAGLLLISAALWVWSMPDEVRIPIVILTIMLLLLWLVASYPCFVVARKLHLPIGFQAWLFVMPLLMTGLPAMVLFAFGTLPSVATFLVVGAVAIAGRTAILNHLQGAGSQTNNPATTE